jgi:Right handed beta helix region
MSDDAAVSRRSAIAGFGLVGAAALAFHASPAEASVADELLDQGGMVFNAKAYGILPGASDVTALVQGRIDAIAQLPAGGVLYFPPGTYVVGPLRVVAGGEGPVRIVGHDARQVRFSRPAQTTSSAPSLYISRSGTRVSGIAFEDRRSSTNTLASEGCVVALDCSDVTIESCIFTGFAVSLGSAVINASGTGSPDGTSGRKKYTTRVVVSNCVIEAAGTASVPSSFRPPSVGIRFGNFTSHCRAENNRIDLGGSGLGCVLLGFAGGSGVTVDPESVTDHWVKGNVLSGSGHYAIGAVSGRRIRIDNNDCVVNGYEGIVVYDYAGSQGWAGASLSDVFVTNNRLRRGLITDPNAQTPSHIYLKRVSGCIVTGNLIDMEYDAARGGTGIYIANQGSFTSSDCLVRENLIRNVGSASADYAIVAEYSSTNIAIDSNLTNGRISDSSFVTNSVARNMRGGTLDLTRTTTGPGIQSDGYGGDKLELLGGPFKAYGFGVAYKTLAAYVQRKGTNPSIPTEVGEFSVVAAAPTPPYSDPGNGATYQHRLFGDGNAEFACSSFPLKILSERGTFDFHAANGSTTPARAGAVPIPSTAAGFIRMYLQGVEIRVPFFNP